jgi:ABC-2 type transport system ATP-binding protein
MLSTHIMQEVEAICDRAIIIKKGKIVADNKLEILQNKGVEIIDVEFQNPLLISVLENIKEVKQVVQKSETRFEFISDDSQDIRPLISQFAIDNSNLVVNMQKREEKMEDIFQNLTRE